jgi:ethanolamine kinase
MTQPTRNGERNGAGDHVRLLPVPYNSQDPQGSAIPLVLAVQPDWADKGSNLELVRCTDGITNTLLKVINKKAGMTKDEVDDQAILLRAYGNGTDVIIDRERETENHELLMKYGLAPELLARFENGMLYRYIRGKVTSPEDLRDARIYKAVARRLAQWHSTVPCLPSSAAANGNGNGNANANGNSNGVKALNGSGRSKEDLDGALLGKPAPNVWTVMQKWIVALPTETESQRDRQASLRKELRLLIRDLSHRPGLGENGVRHPPTLNLPGLRFVRILTKTTLARIRPLRSAQRKRYCPAGRGRSR